MGGDKYLLVLCAIPSPFDDDIQYETSRKICENKSLHVGRQVGKFLCKSRQ